jgi:hypothetical protein
MVANFNLKWKNACIEILNYVSQRLRLEQQGMD